MLNYSKECVVLYVQTSGCSKLCFLQKMCAVWNMLVIRWKCLRRRGPYSLYHSFKMPYMPYGMMESGLCLTTLCYIFVHLHIVGACLFVSVVKLQMFPYGCLTFCYKLSLNKRKLGNMKCSDILFTAGKLSAYFNFFFCF